MEKHSYDIEVGPEIVNSLARSLKDSQQQLKQSEKKVKELEKSKRILTESVERLKKENIELNCELAAVRDCKTAVKVEPAEIIPKREEVELENNVETEEVQGYHMAHWTSQYEQIKEKYRKEKAKRRQARQQCDTLTTQLAEVTGEGAALSKRHRELEILLEKIKKDFESRKAIHLHDERKMLRDAMEKYPFDRSQLQVGPIARHSFTIANFRKFLSSNPKIQSFASTDESICLQFSDPFLWCGKPGGHALLFGPCHTLQLNDIEAKWIAHPMKDMYGATRELFVVNHDTAYYDGTYKCLPLSHGMIPGGCSDLSGLDLEALARTTVSDQGASYKLYQDSFEAVVDLWKSNILKVECVGLQHVGFNEGLYNALVQMGRKLGDKESGCMKSRVEGRAKSSTKRTISEYSEKHEHPVKRRKES